MDKLSALIQEAKPLYKQRKRNKAICLALFILIMPTFLFVNVLNLYKSGNDVYLSLNSNTLQEELLLDDMDLLR